MEKLHKTDTMKKKEIDMSKYTIGIDPYDKQETPEEAAERIYPMVSNEYLWHIPIETRKIFIEGTKWQQERSYSEEEFKEIIYHMVGGLAQANNMTFNGAILDELFNKFKKK